MELPGLMDEGAAADTEGLTSVVRMPVESREELLDIATVLTLCDSKPELLLTTIVSMGNDQRESIRHTGEATRAVIRPHLQAVLDLISTRLGLRAGLKVKRERVWELREEIASYDERISELEAKLAKLRREEIARRLETDSTVLKQEYDVNIREVSKALADETAAREKRWQEQQPTRAEQIKRLEGEAERARAVAAESAKRTAALGHQFVTYQMARFLSWLGYASVAATGAMWTLIVKEDATKDVAAVLASVHEFVSQLSSSPLLSYTGAGGVLLLSLAAVLGVALAVDQLLRRTFKSWGNDQAENERLSIQLNAISVSRRSYLQLVAALPFVFAGGLFLAFLAVGPSGGARKLENLLPTAAHTFIGSAIALLATAAFVMFAIKWVEPRLNGKEDGRGWEFVVPPSVLIIACVLASFSTSPNRLVWGGWTLFMLLSSLALAYGLIYDGVYDESRWARRVLAGIEKELIRANERPADDAARADAERRLAAVNERYRRDLADIQSRARANRSGSTMPQPTMPASPNVVVLAPAKVRTGWMRRMIKNLFRKDSVEVAASSPTPPAQRTWDDIDVMMGEEIVHNIGVTRARQAARQAELTDLSTEIAEEVALSAWTAIEELLTKRANLAGIIDQSEARDRASQALMSKAEKELYERVRAAIAAASKLSGPFGSAAAEATPLTPVPFSPGTTPVRPKGANYDV